jgi:hypothetical protein
MADVKIAPALRDLRVEIDTIAPWPSNPRQGDVGAIVESLRRFGQQKPVVVQESSRYIVAGNHLWHAAKALGWSEIAANVVSMDDRTAEAYLLADNRTSELGSYDDDLLGEFLRKVAQESNLQGTGYDGEDVDDFLKGLERANAGKVPAEITFASELLESHNYVVLVFDNELDWNSAKTKLAIETVRAPDATETYDRRGVGRILRGVDVLRMIP